MSEIGDEKSNVASLKSQFGGEREFNHIRTGKDLLIFFNLITIIKLYLFTYL
jgi:hypothetical protein